MTQGRSIRLFLVDGTSRGLLTAEIVNWTGHVLTGPRSRLGELVQRPECARTASPATPPSPVAAQRPLPSPAEAPTAESPGRSPTRARPTAPGRTNKSQPPKPPTVRMESVRATHDQPPLHGAGRFPIFTVGWIGNHLLRGGAQ